MPREAAHNGLTAFRLRRRCLVILLCLFQSGAVTIEVTPEGQQRLQRLRRDVSLVDAAGGGNTEAVRAAVRDGAAVDNRRGPNGATPLIVAANEGHGDACRVLLRECGADPNAIGRDGRTALMSAASRGDAHMCRVLLGGGADERIKNWKGETAVGCATGDAVQRLLSDLPVSGGPMG